MRLFGFSLSIVLIGLPMLVLAQSRAEYMVTFESTWSAATHPVDFPANPHFSGLIGGTHDNGVVFWNPGELASTGIENMAELGSKTALQAEVEAAIEGGMAESVLSWLGIGLSPGSVSFNFEVSQAFPLVTLVSMLAPSPDWFVGVHGLNLFDGGAWVEEVVVDLFVYDAGTDSGTSYTSPNDDTQPPENIALITTEPFLVNESIPPVGTFTFTRVSVTAPTTFVHARVLLHGALSEAAAKQSGVPMRTDLQALDLIPLQQPYDTPPWNHAGTEQVSGFNYRVVDWVLVHLRSTTDGANLASQAGLLLSDGTITDRNGVSRLGFPGVSPGNYFVVVEHRNHLSVMSATALALDDDPAFYDFSTGAAQAHGADQYERDGSFALYAGDATTDNQVVYIGPDRDQLPIINRLGTSNLAGTSQGYFPEDLNMDGQVVYIGGARDQRIILETLGIGSLADVKASNVP